MVVTPRRWNQTTIARTTLLFMFPPKGPQGWVTMTARFELQSATADRAAESGSVNFFSRTEEDGEDGEDGDDLALVRVVDGGGMLLILALRRTPFGGDGLSLSL